ncbi:hypothetical protein TCSYLVIO_008911 [Trypanosoma cruzi]|uniref:Uncharacterized protein n=1 Tax=Trypanosoma cruzi Dm28c TaxID=1416333 RepID=V5BNW1_TRYCR|nr:hypothetical protein TCSYLVIO_008911 [Trypanosoma cruzi]ESS66248.1 hypothetical protein TCDM_05139 [Trypanosoma cruzi Dm28c]KAF8290113.1 hypothetical protein TcBrA4_0134650 [Trypanosoma cruzi]RNF20968.1 hypothetical protein TcG_03375 [Trypanosoma cruzi]
MSTLTRGEYTPCPSPPQFSTPVLPSTSVFSSLNTWVLLDPIHIESPRTLFDESFSAIVPPAVSTANQTIRSSSAGSNLTCGVHHQEDFSSGWSILSTKQSQLQSGNDLCDLVTSEHSFSNNLLINRKNMDGFQSGESNDEIDQFGLYNSMPFTSREYPCGKNLRRRTTLPFRKCSGFYCPTSISCLAFHFTYLSEMGNGSAAYTLFRNVVHPMGAWHWREKIPSESSDGPSPEMSVGTMPVHNHAKGWGGNSKNEPSISHHSDDATGENSSNRSNDSSGEETSVVSFFLCMPFLRFVLKTIAMMASGNENVTRRSGHRRRRRRRRGGSGGTGEGSDSRLCLGERIFGEMEALVTCALHGILVFML